MNDARATERYPLNGTDCGIAWQNDVIDRQSSFLSIFSSYSAPFLPHTFSRPRTQPDISWPLSAMCLVKEITFYEKLVITTLAPIIVLGTLGLSYAAAMRWHQGSDRNSTESRQQVKVRHASVSLLVLFLVGFHYGREQ